MGGVLCSNELPAVTAAWSRRLGISQRSLLGAIYGGSDTGVLVGRVDEETWWQVVAGRLGIGAELLDGLREEMAGAGTWDEQLLASLRNVQGQARVAIVSNAWPHLRRRLVDERVDEIVNDVILSCEVGCAKPDPRIYRLALDRLRVSPKGALFIDDTPAHVAAATSVGLSGHVHINRARSVVAIEQFLGR